MGLISCPSCGEQVSDKSPTCVRCGHSFVQEKNISCAECGAEFEASLTVCPNCGCPVNGEASNADPQQVEITGVNTSHKVRNVAIAAIAVIAVAVIGFFAYSQIMEKKQRKSMKPLFPITQSVLRLQQRICARLQPLLKQKAA